MKEMQEIRVQTLGREDPLEKGMATYSSILPGKSHGQRSLAGYSPRCHKQSDTTEHKHACTHKHMYVCVYIYLCVYICVRGYVHNHTHAHTYDRKWSRILKYKELKNKGKSPHNKMAKIEIKHKNTLLILKKRKLHLIHVKIIIKWHFFLC